MTGRPGIKLGYVSGVYGVKGRIKVYSHTEPRDNILRFRSWLVGAGSRLERFSVEDGGWQGKTIVAKLAGIDSRTEAAQVVGSGIFIERADLPELPENEYYWADLVGLKVFTQDRVFLGVVEGLMETGANDVLVVRGDRERLIPFVPQQVVISVDIEAGDLIVAWEPDF